MFDKVEFVRAWLAPGILVALIVNGVSSVTWLNTIDSRSLINERDISRLEVKVAVVEKTGVEAVARMAVMESQLRNVVDMLMRIEKRMESQYETRPR